MGKRGWDKNMCPHKILHEIPPPTIETRLQACGQSLIVKGGGESLSGCVYY